MASLAAGLSIFGFIPPLIIFLIKRESRFVSFHALQALLWHIGYLILIMFGVMMFVIVMVVTVVAQSENLKHGGPPAALFLAFPLLWLCIVAGGIVNLILAVIYAVKASQGEWADYPVFGQWARKILKMGQS
jgi:uncharacterized membrane protein